MTYTYIYNIYYILYLGVHQNREISLFEPPINPWKKENRPVYPARARGLQKYTPMKSMCLVLLVCTSALQCVLQREIYFGPCQNIYWLNVNGLPASCPSRQSTSYVHMCPPPGLPRQTRICSSSLFIQNSPKHLVLFLSSSRGFPSV